MQLRPYQIEAKRKVYQAFHEHRRVLLTLPTGAGKTVLFTDICRDAYERKSRVLVLVHRKELIEQASEKLFRYGLRHGIIQPEYPYTPMRDIQVASVQTLVRRKMPPDIGLVICDEAHHSRANSYRTIYDNYPEAKILGVTATPVRTSGAGFEDLFDDLVVGTSVRELIELGYLVKPQIFANPLRFDLSKVKKTAGDYNEKALYEAMEEKFTYGDLLETWRQKAEGKRTVVFAINLAHSRQIVKTYQEAGIPAEHLDGATGSAERAATLRRFREGETLVLSNVGIVTEGFDVPAIECVQLVRPTKSLGLYLQMVGRGLRPADGKDRAVILDHSDCIFNHGFPESERDWTLKGIKKSKRKTKIAIRDKKTGKVYENVREAPEIRHLDDIELIEISEDSARLRFMRDALRDAKTRGFKPGAAWYKFLAKFGKPEPEDIKLFRQMAGYKPMWEKYRMKEFNYE
ncbi:MAG: DEAD/DEAH box helicase [Candidatus Kapaibacterium sp.]